MNASSAMIRFADLMAKRNNTQTQHYEFVAEQAWAQKVSAYQPHLLDKWVQKVSKD